MKSVGAFEAKTHLSGLLDQVRRGQEFVIQKRGKSIAALVPVASVSGPRSEVRKAAVLDGLRQIRASARRGPKAKALVDLGRKR